MALAGGADATTPTVTEFTGGVTPGLSASSFVPAIAAGPDGNLWFTEHQDPLAPAGRVVRITPAGVVTEFNAGETPGFSGASEPRGIALGPDGNLWFTEGADPGRVARITPAGGVTEFRGGATPGFSENGSPNTIAAGPDGNLWFTEAANPGRVARVTPAGVVTEFTGGVTPGFSANGEPQGIAPGPDGNLWFTESAAPGRVARVTPAGVVTEFTGGVTPGFSANGFPFRITAGPDGNVWFTELRSPGRVARITPAGAVTEFTGGVTPGFSADGRPTGITAGPDGNVWFTEKENPGHVARITPSGVVTEFPAGMTPGFSVNREPFGITLGTDGNLWLTENEPPGGVARITTPPTAVTSAAVASGPTSGAVSGVANGHSQATSFHFEYGPLGGETTTTSEQGLGITGGDTPVSAELSALMPATVYQVRLVVTNPTDSTPGAFLLFKTARAPLPPAPALSGLSLSPAAFVAASRGPSARAAGASATETKRRKTYTLISYRDSQAAITTFTVLRSQTGVRVHGRCVKAPTHASRAAKHCQLLVSLGGFSHADNAGSDRVRFTGRVRGRKLTPGRYLLRALARNSAGEAGAPLTKGFRIVR